MTTRWTVRAADRVANWVIAVGGVGTIIAVSGVFVFLVSVVVPLFVSGRAEEESRIPGGTSIASIRMGLDEYRVAGWALAPDGSLHVFRLDDGAPVARHAFVKADSVSAWSWRADDGTVRIGYPDGTVGSARVRFVTDFPLPADVPGGTPALSPGQRAVVQGGVVERTPEGKLRRQRLRVEMGPRVDATGGVRIERIDHTGGGDLFALIDSAGVLYIERVDQTENLLTGDVEIELTGGHVETPYAAGKRGRATPDRLLVSPAGTSVWLVWRDGSIVCYDTRDIDHPVLAGEVSVEVGGEITALATLLGGNTLLIGDATGSVTGAFRYRGEGDGGKSFRLALAHTYEGRDARVASIASSQRSRIFSVGYADGHVRVFEGTSEATVLDIDAGAPVTGLAVAPKDDGLAVLTADGISVYKMQPGHPEATLGALFRPVWYEGYAEPSHVWQSSSGTDDFEAKLGLWPLVFGTLKATLYSMMFAVPLALLAAVYTSEFMKGPLRLRVKTLVESMASLPSVVLGFLAALVIAPFVQNALAPVLTAMLVVPAGILAGAYLWQLLPQHLVHAWERWRLPAIFAALAVAILVSRAVGYRVEDLFFGGSMVSWLDGRQGGGVAGWAVLLLPASAVAVTLAFSRLGGGAMRRMAERSTRRRAAMADLARFVLGAVSVVVLAAIGGAALSAAGIDPRGPDRLMDTYVQRNALIVGFIMGFAVIPIIYTIAEDALTAVPDHLRAASLGAGATPWQTAVRIVLPTAMSGLFSAIMIGLGRAVGETMIVLMAAGNTPILEMNMFNGFRTLSANIAVELPEAVRDSTHYRTLFLAALLLFVMTFVLNSVAEVIRLRFRKRSSQI